MTVLTKKWRASRIECGRHSGFPDCCITFFVDDYMPVFVAGEGAKFGPYLQRIADAKYERGFIPCPDCLEKKRPQVILPCDCIKKYLAEKRRREGRDPARILLRTGKPSKFNKP